jgi:glycosyltransferase involved in cell wall biosynthesis
MIVSNVGGLSDFVLNPNWVVPPKDHSALADAIICCLKDPSRIKQMKSDAEKISQKFSWLEIADKTERIYQQVLNHI